MTVTKQELDPKELNWTGTRFLDPIGRVFLLDGDYYRAIYPNKVDYTENILKTGIVEMLANAGLMIPVEHTDLSVKGYGMVLKTKGATWKIPGHTFTFCTLKTAALNWITINELLLKHNLGLIDANLSNFTLTGRCEPKWLDLGSIQPLCHAHYGVGGFIERLLYPLLVFKCKPNLARTVRFLIQDGGISRKEFFDLVGWHLLRFPLLCSAVIIMLIMLRALRNYDMEVSSKRRWILRLLRFVIESINLELPQSPRPDVRESDMCEMNEAGRTLSTDKECLLKVIELIKLVQPKTMLDMGACDECYSALAVRSVASY